MSIPPEQIPRVHFLLHIVEVAVVPVGDDRLALRLELRQIVDHTAAEERRSVLQRGFVDGQADVTDARDCDVHVPPPIPSATPSY